MRCDYPSFAPYTLSIFPQLPFPQLCSSPSNALSVVSTAYIAQVWDHLLDRCKPTTGRILPKE